MTPAERNRRRPGRRVETSSMARHIFFGVLVILLITLIASLIYYVTRRESVTIKEVTITGGETISHEGVRKAVERALTGNYFLLIPYRFAYLYPHDRIISEVGDDPRLHDIVVERSSPRELKVTFEEYVPGALWCLTDAEDAVCSFITDDGYAFGEAPPLLGGSLIRFVERAESELRTGQIIPTERMSMTKELIRRLNNELALRIVQVIHTEDRDLELYVGGGGKLLIADDADIDHVLKNLTAILSSKEFDHIEPGNFKYIDLRFGNKLFVKEHDDPVATTTGQEVFTE